jgi:hypothetical protein
MIRILALTAIFAVLCPTLSAAADVSVSPMTRLAALTFGAQNQKLRMTPRPSVIRTACYDPHVRCDSASTCYGQCCQHTFQCDRNGYCECS